MTYDLGLFVELSREQLRDLQDGHSVEIDLHPEPEEGFNGATVFIRSTPRACECNCGCEPTNEWHSDPMCVCRKVRCPCAVAVS